MLNKKIKIGFFSGYFPVCPGGAEYQAYLLAKSLDRERHDVFFISVGNDNSGRKVIDGFSVYFIKPPRLPAVFGKTFSLLYWQIRKILESEKPDVVYQRGAYSATGILAYLSDVLTFKLIWACASSVDLNIKTPLGVGVFNTIEAIVAKYGIKKATKILVQSYDQKKNLKDKFGLESEILKNAHPRISEPMLIKEKDRIVILFVGNIKKVKQPEVFIRLAQKFISKNDVSFVMIGRSGNDKYSLGFKDLLADTKNIKWLGELSQHEVNMEISSSYVLVNTSLYEGFSNTFIQAWQRGVPVLSLNVDPDALLSEGGLGLCSGSFEKLSKDLEFLLDNPSLRNTMGESGCKYALEEHSLDVISDRFKMILAEVMNG